MAADNIGNFGKKDVYYSFASVQTICEKKVSCMIRRDQGFSILEILVTIVIFGLGVLALASMQVRNVQGTGFNKDAGTATALAQAQLENLKSMSFDSIASNLTGVTQGTMNVSWDVTTYGTAPHRYKDVTVAVVWAGKSISCHTIITEP